MLSNEPPSDERGRRGRRGAGGQPGAEREYVGAGFIGGVVLLILLGIVLVALIAQNADPVAFNLLWLEAEIALAALVLGSAVAAVLAAEMVGLIWRRRRRKYRALKEHESH